MLQRVLCDYRDAYIVVKGTVIAEGADDDAYETGLSFKNNAPFISSIISLIIHLLTMQET